MNTKQGPNVKKLIARYMAKQAIPDGGGFTDGINFLTDKDRVTKTAREATEWVEKTLDLIRNASGSKQSNEELAEVILKRVEQREAQSERQNKKSH